MDTKSNGKRKSASRWDAVRERALLEVWSLKICQLRGCRKNSHILSEMVEELKTQGFLYTVAELQTKMHNMTARYRKEKQTIGISGDSPSNWDLYKDMETLLAPYKSYNTEGLVVDSVNRLNCSIRSSPPPLPSPSSLNESPLSSPSPSQSTENPLSARSSSRSLPSTSSTAIKKREGFEKLIKDIGMDIKCMKEELKDTNQKSLKIEEEKRDILKAYVDREAEVQKALVEFLKRP